MLDILSCGASIDDAEIIASLFPFAPACAKPLNIPKTTMFSPAITSAPSFTSPKTTKLPSNSIFCPDLNDPLWNFVSDTAISLLYVLTIPCKPKVLGLSKFISTSKYLLIKSCISSISLFLILFQ